MGQEQLLLIIDANRSMSFFFRLGENWQQHTREDGNDRDDNQQLDKGKADSEKHVGGLLERT